MSISLKSIISIALLSFISIGCAHKKAGIVGKTKTKSYRSVQSLESYDFEAAYKRFFELNNPKPEETDIAIDFLQAVVKYNRSSYSFAAKRIFYKYLEYNLLSENSTPAFNFIENLMYFYLTKEEEVRYKEATNAEDRFKMLIQIWEDKDPDPTTNGNEALLVFFQRYNEVIQLFQANGLRESIDERSEYWIRYGKPNVRRFVTFGLTSLDNWLSRLYGSANEFEQYDSSSPQILATVQKVQRTMRNPKMELWVYDGLNNESPSTVFYFGQFEGAQYRRIDSPEELIPAELRRTPNLSQISLLPGSAGAGTPINAEAAIVAAMYDEIPRVHPTVTKQAMDIMINIDSPASVQGRRRSSNLAARERANSANELRRDYLITDQQRLTEGEQVQLFPIIREFRYLNQRNEPNSLLISYSEPFEGIRKAAGFIDDINSDLKLIHTLFFLDEDQKVVSKVYDEASIQLKANVRAEGVYPSQTAIRVLADSLPSRSLRLNSMLKQVKSPRDSLFNPLTGIIAAGVTDFTLKDPLVLNENEPLISDVMLGFGRPNENEYAEIDGLTRFRFFIPPTTELPIGYDLSLYFEVYNLMGESPAFVLNYTLKKANALGIMRPLSDRSSVRTVFLARESTHAVDLDIEMADLTEEGRYRLDLEVTDRSSQQKTQRSVEFILIDPEKRLESNTKEINKRLGIENK